MIGSALRFRPEMRLRLGETIIPSVESLFARLRRSPKKSGPNGIQSGLVWVIGAAICNSHPGFAPLGCRAEITIIATGRLDCTAYAQRGGENGRFIIQLILRTMSLAS